MRFSCIVVIAFLAMALLTPQMVFAVTLPGAADSSRIQRPTMPTPMTITPPDVPLHVMKTEAPPAEAKSVIFVLKGVTIEGADGLSHVALSDLYSSYINHHVTLEMAWVLASQITDRYKKSGYFLTRAYVPAQTIENGIVHIRVAEGFIESVSLDPQTSGSHITNAWIERIKSYHPISTKQLEQALLELNALNDYQFRAVLTPPKEKKGADGAAHLDLVATKQAPHGKVKLDNFGSRYLGPYRAQMDYDFSPLNDQKTSLSLFSSLPAEELKGASVRHSIALAPQWSMDINSYYTQAAPGYRLAVQDIKSDTYGLGIGGTYQWMRQRTENMASRIEFDWMNTQSDILGTPLTRDKIRRLQAAMTYDTADRWSGYSMLSASVTQGINGLGGSKAGQANLSRARAKPNFTKLEIAANRLQNIDNNFQIQTSFAGQLASGPLYSSEEFGYGGQSFGRAYDNSEITGDHGASASIELRYAGVQPVAGITSTPYAFYDAGIIFNDDEGQPARETASSTGIGLRMENGAGTHANLAIAFPLARKIDAPIYTHNGRAARFMAELAHEF